MEEENKTGGKKTPLAKKIKAHMTPTRIILLGFMGLILFGTILFVLPIASKSGKTIGFVNALFLATSSVCVTGLTVLDPATQLTVFGQIVMLFLIQAGGLGFMTTTTLMLLLVGKKISLRERMTMQESLAQDNLKGVVKLTKNILIFTFIIEGFGMLMLMTRFIPSMGAKGIYYALFTAVSAFCNAGFDVFGAEFGEYSSLMPFASDPVVVITVACLIILGGLGFIVCSDVFRKKRNKPLSLHSRVALTMTFSLLLIGTAIFLGVEYKNVGTLGNMSFGEKLLNAFFQSTTSRTAGFSTINQGAMTEGSKMITVILMFIGASPASTGGGVKTTTLFVMIMLLLSVFRDDDEIVYQKETLNQKVTRKAGVLIIFAFFVLISQSLLLWAFESGRNEALSFLDCVFEAASAFGTVGLTTGITTELRAISKLTLCLTMFIGRLGPITLGMAILRKAKNNKPKIEYPDAKILIG